MTASERAGLRSSAEWRFFGALWEATPSRTAAWWALVVVRGLLPAAFALMMGATVSAVTAGDDVVGELVVISLLFLAMQSAGPLHDVLSTLMGARLTSWLHERLLRACVDPSGIAHLEDRALADRLSSAREFDQGVSGPDITAAMPNVGGGFSRFAGGLTQAALLVGFRWWAPLVVGGAWLSTHHFLKKGAIWHGRQDDDIREMQRKADYAYRLAVQAPAAKEIRMFGLADWLIVRFRDLRHILMERSWEERRLGWRTVRWALLVVGGANIVFFWSLATSAADGSIGAGAVVVFAQAAIGASSLAFAEWDWWFRTAAQPVPLVLDLAADMEAMGGLRPTASPAPAMPAGEPLGVSFEGVSFTYPGTTDVVLDGLDLTVEPGTSLAIVGQNGAGKTTLAKLLCRLYEPTEGRILAAGVDLAALDVAEWRTRLAAVFQDFIRYEWSLADNVAPTGADPAVIEGALQRAAALDLVDPDVVLSKAYAGGTDLSGGQWQRVAIARALAAVQGGASVLVLDEPTAHLDVRAETAIFDRVLESARGTTVILISHRFATVRRADRIAVVEHGRVIEAGTHEELMALGGRYHTMFTLQAARFTDGHDADPTSPSGDLDETDAAASADVLATLTEGDR